MGTRMLAEGQDFYMKRRAANDDFAENGDGILMILCVPEKVFDGDTKFQGF